MTSPVTLAETADTLRARRDELTRLAVDELYRRHPEWEERWGAPGRESTARDTAFHLEFLEAAVRADAPQVFARYSAWLAGVLRARRVPLEAVHESYALLGDLLRAHLPADAHARVADVLALGAREVDAPPHVPGAAAAHDAHPAAGALLEALLAGERRRGQDVLVKLLEGGMGPAEVGDRVVRPAMTEIGRLWQENLISVAQEHLATAIVQTALARAFALVRLPAPRGAKALLACVEGNHHALGLRVVGDAFEAEGWDVRYLGADVPTRDLVAQAREDAPDLVGLSLSLPGHVAVARRAVDALRGACRARIVAGGLPFSELDGMDVIVGADAWFPDATAFVRGAR